MSYSFISYFVLSCLRQAGLSALNCGDAAVSTFLMTEVFFSSAFLVVCFVLGCLFVCLLFVLFFQIFCFFVFQCLIFLFFFYSCQNCFDVFWKHYMTLRLKSMAYKNLEVNLSTPCLNMPHHMYQPGPGSINLPRFCELLFPRIVRNLFSIVVDFALFVSKTDDTVGSY